MASYFGWYDTTAKQTVSQWGQQLAQQVNSGSQLFNSNNGFIGGSNASVLTIANNIWTVTTTGAQTNLLQNTGLYTWITDKPYMAPEREELGVEWADRQASMVEAIERMRDAHV